jgi:hypothetical protein
MLSDQLIDATKYNLHPEGQTRQSEVNRFSTPRYTPLLWALRAELSSETLFLRKTEFSGKILQTG